MSKMGKKHKKPETRKNMHSLGKKRVASVKTMTVYTTPNGYFIRRSGRLVQVYLGHHPFADFELG